MAVNNKTKIIFWGTPDFAVPFLSSLTQDDDFTVLAVVTQPDKPTGRKQTLTSSPVKIFAQSKEIAVLQPDSIKGHSEIISQLKNLEADLFVVVAYGKIIPQEILDIPKLGAINVHPSLLPKYRGASPIQSAILNGDNKTGVTIILMDAKMDHGPILTQEEIALNGTETNESLHQKLADLGQNILIEIIKKFVGGEIKPQEQNHANAVFCREIKKEEAKINWSEPAELIERKIRAYYPWPATWTIWQGKRIKIFPPTEVTKLSDLPLLPDPSAWVEEERLGEVGETKKLTGSVEFKNNKLIVKCGQDSLIINKLQIEGKKENSAKEFVQGNREIVGDVLES